jgi:elongation factor 1-beta
VGSIAAQYDLMPESAEVDIQDVVKAIPGVIPDGVKFLDAKVVPIAFGLKKIVVGIIIDDSKESIGTILEDALSGLPGIENIECISSALL